MEVAIGVAVSSVGTKTGAVAVGVGGAPGGHLDEECANAGIDKVKELLK